MKKISLFCIAVLSNAALPAHAENLLEVYQQALQSDPNLKSAELQFELSETQQAQAGGALLPQASASVNVSYNNRSIAGQSGSSDYKGERYSVSITQSLIDVSKFSNWLRYQSLTDKSLADYQQAQQILIYDVVDRYFNVLVEQDNLKLSKQEVSATEKNLEQLKRQYEKNIVKITDVYELEAKLDALLAGEIEIETQLDIVKQNLMELTGESLKGLATLNEGAQFSPLSGEVQQVAQQAQLNNPLIHAQNKAIEAADYDVLSQQARHLPVVELQLQYYNTDNGFQNSQTPVIDTKVASINVTIPLFSGGATYYRSQEASKQLSISKQRKISLLRAIEKETRDAFLSANASLRRIKAAKRALVTASKAREAMEKGFKYGMQSIGDVLVSQSREYAAKKDILSAKYTYIKNRVRFEQASGTLSIELLEDINQWLVADID